MTLYKDLSTHSIPYKIGYCMSAAIEDVLRIHKELFSVTTAKIITAITPFYISTRAIDERFQSCFYDPCCHKNIRQFPQSCHKLARFGVGVPMGILSSLMFFAPDPDMRLTAYLFALAWPFVHFAKDIIKSLDTKCCLRPWHEDFSCKKRSTGGFPSGHMANITYTAALWGMRYGPKFAVPLSLCAAFVFADFVNCNRHYLSQLVAGAALGVIYACAVNRVIETRLAQRLTIEMGISCQGNPQIVVRYSF